MQMSPHFYEEANVNKNLRCGSVKTTQSRLKTSVKIIEAVLPLQLLATVINGMMINGKINLVRLD
jgi:hypothetical protein